MYFVNFIRDRQIHVGIRNGEEVFDITRAAEEGFSLPSSLNEVIQGGDKALKAVRKAAAQSKFHIPLNEIQFGPSVVNPGKILCVGLNYFKHGSECNMEIPATPTLFSKFNNALAAHKEPIKLPKSAIQFDYEAELVIVIGKKASEVSKKDALSCIFGYTVGNDLSARDLQFRTGQWLLGKTCDSFAPIGPYLVTADEIDPGNLNIRCKVNGEVRQSANTREMIFDCASVISYASQYITLNPGDIIFTGTPEGVIFGYPEDKRKWLKAGDKVDVTIEKIGTLTNTLT